MSEIECPRLLKCLPVGWEKSLLFTYPLWLANLSWRLFLEVPMYCTEHFLHVIQYMIPLVWQSTSVLISTEKLFAVDFTTLVSLTKGQDGHSAKSLFLWHFFMPFLDLLGLDGKGLGNLALISFSLRFAGISFSLRFAGLRFSYPDQSPWWDFQKRKG